MSPFDMSSQLIARWSYSLDEREKSRKRDWEERETLLRRGRNRRERLLELRWRRSIGGLSHLERRIRRRKRERKKKIRGHVHRPNYSSFKFFKFTFLSPSFLNFDFDPR